MALEYTLYVSDPLTSEELLSLVEQELGLPHDRELVLDPPTGSDVVARSADGFWLAAATESGRGAEIDEEWMGFRPHVSVTFRMAKEGDTHAATLRMLRASSCVLARLSGDGLLALETSVWFIRRGGRTIVNNDPKVFGTPEAELAAIRLPFELGRVPSPADAPP